MVDWERNWRGNGIIAAVLRVRGSGGTPPQSGGWRELSGPGLR